MAARARAWPLLALSGGLALGAGCSREAPPPNLVLITVDTTRADHLTPYGHRRDTTPFLDGLARESVLFEHAASQSGTTPQSLSSLMTGLYPHADGLVTQNDRFVFLRRGNRTLAGILGRAGYRTHGISASIQASSATGVDLGFETFEGVDVAAGQKALRAEEVTTRALAWLSTLDGERPFFLWLHYLDPHYPYAPPEVYADLWSDQARERPGQLREYRWDARDQGHYPLDAAGLREVVLSYDRELRYTDDQLRRLFDEGLRARLDDAWLVFSADHGESLGNNNLIGHNDLFQDILHVPLLVRPPDGRGAGRRVDSGVMLVDVLPTVLDLLRVPPEGELRGVSLRPLLEGRDPGPERLRLAEYPGHQAIFLGRMKLVERRFEDQTRCWLFDVLADAAEHHDLSHTRQALQEELLARAARLREHSLGAAPREDEELPPVSPEMLDELRALGY